MGLEGIQLPSSPLAVIDDLDLCTPSAAAPPPLDWLHVASMSYVPDEVGQHGGACHNSSARHDGRDAINRLRRASAKGTCLEAATPADMEAPQRPHGLCRLPR